MLNLQPLRSIRERDIDLLLLEELYSCPQFQQWFLEQVAPAELPVAHFRSATHSVLSANGESDLVVEYADPDGNLWWFLLENKVDAAFQPEQPERYARRKQEYLRSGHCYQCRTVLIAPSKYLNSNPIAALFDQQLSYEALKAWFEQTADRPRSQFKANLLSIAITQGVYQPIASEIAAQNWRYLHDQLTQFVPEMQVPRLSSSYTAGGWKTLTSKGALPGQLYIIYKSDKGCVDLTFPGQGPEADASQFQRFKASLSPLLDATMSIAGAYQSAVIRIKVTPTRITEPFESQSAAVEEAIEATRMLNQWVRQHHEDCSYWTSASASRPVL